VGINGGPGIHNLTHPFDANILDLYAIVMDVLIRGESLRGEVWAPEVLVRDEGYA
jgi:hypothetical protein